MKFLKIALCAALLSSVGFGFTSCGDDPLNDNFVLNINGIQGIPYDENGVCSDVYNTDIGPFGFGDFVVSHRANESEYGKSWWGFCPSRSTDTNDYSKTGFAGLHEWSSITGGGVLGRGSAYLVGYYDEYNDKENGPVCYITFGKTHKPQFAYVTNTTYGYYALKNGSTYNKQFGPGDWMKVIFIGFNGELETGRVEAFLAKDDKILNTWQKVNLMSLGEVSYVKIIMDSSDKGEWGINTPNYFCIDNYTVKI